MTKPTQASSFRAGRRPASYTSFYYFCLVGFLPPKEEKIIKFSKGNSENVPTLGEYLREEGINIEGLYVVYGTHASYPQIVAMCLANELAKNMRTRMQAIIFTEPEEQVKRQMRKHGINIRKVDMRMFSGTIVRSIIDAMNTYGEVPKVTFRQMFNSFMTALLAHTGRVVYTDVLYVFGFLGEDIVILLSAIAKVQKKTVVTVAPESMKGFDTLLQLADVVIRTEHRLVGTTATYVIAVEKGPKRRYSAANYSITRSGVIIEEVRRYA